MQQKSFTSGFEKYQRRTRKEKFLDEMDRILPWKDLSQSLAPYYPNPQGAGRRPIGLERMLRIYFMQHWYSLSDPAMEEALYDSRAMRDFARILIHGARAVINWCEKKHDALSLWLKALSKRAHPCKVVVALANKLARIVWAVLASKQPYIAI